MKPLFAALAGLMFAVASVQAQSQTTTTTTVTENPDGSVTTTETVRTVTATGMLHAYEPGARFIVQETAGPVTYSYGPRVVYATRGGAVLTPEQVQARIRVGVPVSVDYRPVGETRVIERVIIDD
jgi:Tfp pilus assembly protein FimT